MIYSIYDTTGIQSYIFASSKLRENIGASKLVGEVFTEFLPQVLESTFGKDNVITSWSDKHHRETTPWIFTKTAEIIYVGGGNAYVAYKTLCDYKKATAAFLHMVYNKTATIGIASAFVETDFKDDYEQKHKDLMRRLSQSRGEINHPLGAGSQPITRASLLTGRPVTHIDQISREQLSQDQYCKRDVNSGGLDSFDSLKLGSTSFLAVVHVDGNNISQHIEQYMKNGSNSWSEVVPKIREMSYSIDMLYKEALNATNATFDEFYKGTSYYKKDESTPQLPIICGGDDITCVVSGLWGISYAAELLMQIESHSKMERLYPFKHWPEDDKKPHISACAGVVLFHSHYPFSEAYKMAEACCKNAKGYTRNADKHTNDIAGSFMDFHLHQGGMIADLKSLRSRQYSIGENILVHPPYCVLNPDTMEAETLELFKNKYQCFTDFTELMSWAQKNDSAWPRSRLKALRDSIADGENEVKKVLAWCKAKDYTLPEAYDPEITYKKYASPEDEEKGKALYKYALLFSVLEFADIYKDIRGAKNAHNTQP
ncbi:MAG: hypothetical protein FWE11_03085 [Defluviitaleaceae bacterium]|nr:hypothetical protein [Defluviitaleaceae bacterium]